MGVLQDVLDKHHRGITAEQFVAELDRRWSQVPRVVPPVGVVRFLADHGGPEVREALSDFDSRGEYDRRRDVAEQAVVHIVESSIGTQAAAELLGVHRTTISRRIRSRELYAVEVQGQHLLPLWQFDRGRELPHLKVVGPTIPPGVHPAVVEGFMTTKQSALSDRTPIDHLLSGGDPEVVAALVAELDR